MTTETTARLSRTQLMPDGKYRSISISICRCDGFAEKAFDGNGKHIGWTDGQRGPSGGVCGACMGAIP